MGFGVDACCVKCKFSVIESTLHRLPHIDNTQGMPHCLTQGMPGCLMAAARLSSGPYSQSKCCTISSFSPKDEVHSGLYSRCCAMCHVDKEHTICTVAPLDWIMVACCAKMAVVASTSVQGLSLFAAGWWPACVERCAFLEST